MRINRGLDVDITFEVTIVVGSVCFSCDLGPRTSCVSFSLIAVKVCL